MNEKSIFIYVIGGEEHGFNAERFEALADFAYIFRKILGSFVVISVHHEYYHIVFFIIYDFLEVFPFDFGG